MPAKLTTFAAGALVALILPAAAGAEPLPYCQFETSVASDFAASGGSKSWFVKQGVRLWVLEGANAEFRHLHPDWLTEDFFPGGNATLSYGSNGDVVFRSNYLVTSAQPRKGADIVLEAQGKALFLILKSPDRERPEALARLTHQQASENIDLFGIVKGAEAERLFSLAEAGTNIELMIGSQDVLLATSYEVPLQDFAETRAAAEQGFAAVQADVASGTCK